MCFGLPTILLCTRGDFLAFFLRRYVVGGCLFCVLLLSTGVRSVVVVRRGWAVIVTLMCVVVGDSDCSGFGGVLSLTKFALRFLALALVMLCPTMRS